MSGLIFPHNGLIKTKSAAAFGGWTITNGTVEGARSSSYTLTLGTSPASGELILVFLAKENATDDGPTISGFTELAQITTGSTPSSSFAGCNYLLGKISDGTEGTSLSVTVGANRRHSSVGVVINGNRNGLTTDEFAVIADVPSPAPTHPDPVALTPTWGSAETLWFTSMNCEGGGPMTPSSGYTELADDTSQSRAELHVQYRENTTATENPGALVASTTGKDALIFTIGIRPND